LQRVAPSPLPAVCAAAAEAPARTVEDDMNAALGCKTSEVALALLAQVVSLEHATFTAADEATVDRLLASATASLAELDPKTATEAMLAVQMIGTQRTAMTFLERATLPGQTSEGIDANMLRSTRLMRLFNEQVETMAKLKGKGGQQRVVVEHVTVAAGGQAIVGSVTRGWGGIWRRTRMNPMSRGVEGSEMGIVAATCQRCGAVAR
jgi:hypothetical protein